MRDTKEHPKCLQRPSCLRIIQNRLRWSHNRQLDCTHYIYYTHYNRYLSNSTDLVISDVKQAKLWQNQCLTAFLIRAKSAEASIDTGFTSFVLPMLSSKTRPSGSGRYCTMTHLMMQKPADDIVMVQDVCALLNLFNNWMSYDGSSINLFWRLRGPHHSGGWNSVKSHNTHFTFNDLKKSVEAIRNKDDWCRTAVQLTRPPVLFFVFFFFRSVLRAQPVWLWHFQTNVFSLHFTLLNLSDDISMAVHLKIRMCADIFLVHLISCWVFWEKRSDGGRKWG